VEAFAQGVRSAANDTGIAVVGGDLSAARQVMISVAAVGRGCARGALTRSGAKPRDTLWISGTLGAAAAGLALLEAGYRVQEGSVTGPRGRRVASPRADDLGRMIRHQADPRPAVELGRTLADGELASAAIDVSDGLARDLHRLCRASGVGAVVDASQLPLDSGLAAAADAVPFDARAAALYGGEDFGLLFTTPKRKLADVDRLASRFALRRIGEIDGSGEVTLVSEGRRALLPDRGFDHFEKAPTPRKKRRA
jgi:thiamine-monophosphate kinase